MHICRSALWYISSYIEGQFATHIILYIYNILLSAIYNYQSKTIDIVYALRVSDVLCITQFQSHTSHSHVIYMMPDSSQRRRDAPTRAPRHPSVGL